MPYNSNGPRAGRTTGRARNTLLNNQSKAATPAPVVSPSSATAYGGMLATAQMTLAERLAALRAQKGIVAGQFRMDRAAVKANRIAGISDAVNSALSAGTVGSSYDLEQRTGVAADAAAGIQAALQARLQGKLGIQTERISALNNYYTTIFDVQARKAAEQADMANQAFMNDLVMRLGDESAPVMQTGPATTAPAATSPQQQATLDWLRERLASGRM